MKNILLVGPSNVGKSSLFNKLCGTNRKVANYHGITVDTGMALLSSTENSTEQDKLVMVDLPGIYTLVPTSIDEAVTLQTLLGKNPKVKEFHQILCVVDVERIDASLSLVLALKELFGKKVRVVFNKGDLKNKVAYDIDKIASDIGLDYIVFSTFDDSEDIIEKFIKQDIGSPISANGKVEITEKSIEYNPFDVDYKSLKEVEIIEEKAAIQKLEVFQATIRTLKSKHAVKSKSPNDNGFLDKLILHPVIGMMIFFSIFYLIFHSIYTWSGPAMDLIDEGVGSFSEVISAYLPDGYLQSFIVDGVIAGVGGVVIFLPQIMVLFFLLSILEQSGYISRASIMVDKVMHMFGLNGKAFLPFLSGYACAIPAVMATRRIADKKERMATLMTIPLLTCSARLPVYVLLIGTFIPNKTVFGVFNSQALSFFFLYFLGGFTALIIAKLFRLTIYKGKSTSFIIELPSYQRPSLRVATKDSLLRGKIFLKKAGTIILTLSMAIWFLSTFPKPSEEITAGKSESEIAALTLENSAIGKFGKLIEPVIKPLGFDWKMGVGITVAMGARELFVSTLGTIYALGDVDEESSSLRERLLNEKNPETGEPVFNLAVAWSLLIFFAFAMQCIATIGIVKREADGWKDVWFMFAYMTLLAYGGSFLTFNLLN